MRFHRILAAIDLGPQADRVTAGSRRALDRAAWLAGRLKCPLTLLHSGVDDEYWDEAGGFVHANAAGQESRPALDAALSELKGGGLQASVAVRDETPWLAIVHEVLREDVDLVVAGKRTNRHSDGRKLGTVARKLLRKCPCAVWLEDPRKSADPAVVLAATDLTPVGDRAVELAASVADALDAKLHVVHAYSVSLEAQMEGGEARREYESEKHAEATRHIEEVLAATPIAGAAELHVGRGSASQAVLDGVAALNPGLVVMGTVSRGGIPGLLMGNTAERLIDRIDCALLTVKPDDFVCPVEPA
ncbi:MAG: universal stress protein [Proteobacteria bacterium]|nr:universal stress protein [Pseudomonadota bacterium]